MEKRSHGNPQEEYRLRNFSGAKNVTLAVRTGADIKVAIAEAIQLSRRYYPLVDGGTTISFNHNGIKVSLKADSDPELIIRDYFQATERGSIAPKVGPYPKRSLTKKS
jgi:hypothetical protein